VLRLAGSGDPALDLALRSTGADHVVTVGARGSFHGLTGLWRGTADAAAIHLPHRSGVHKTAPAAPSTTWASRSTPPMRSTAPQNGWPPRAGTEPAPGTVCCYALQDKVWAHDPDRLAWEYYTVLEHTETP
jgi:hypothetical protein